MEYFAIDFETANDYQNSACSVGVVVLLMEKKWILFIL